MRAGTQLAFRPFTTRPLRAAPHAWLAATSTPFRRLPSLESELRRRQVSYQRGSSHHLSASPRLAASAAASEQLQAVIFDCDGVIVESEDLHRDAYNAAFAHHAVQCGSEGTVDWSEAFYDELSNKVGGGKGKMRWYFGKHGWPSSNVLDHVPESEEDQSTLIDTLQDWKSLKYQEIIGKEAEPRAGVLRLVDEARQAGLKVAVASAATKSSVIHVVKSLFGEARYEALDAFLAGDDVPAKKPDPSIYILAAERMGVQPEQCLVIEDSAIGLQAAMGAGMRCVITYTRSSRAQTFDGAELILDTLDHKEHKVTVESLLHRKEHYDDRLAAVS